GRRNVLGHDDETCDRDRGHFWAETASSMTTAVTSVPMRLGRPRQASICTLARRLALQFPNWSSRLAGGLHALARNAEVECNAHTRTDIGTRFHLRPHACRITDYFSRSCILIAEGYFGE